MAGESDKSGQLIAVKTVVIPPKSRFLNQYLLFCCNIGFTIPKQSQKLRAIVYDRFRFLELFWKERRRNPTYDYDYE